MVVKLDVDRTYIHSIYMTGGINLVVKVKLMSKQHQPQILRTFS